MHFHLLHTLQHKSAYALRQLGQRDGKDSDCIKEVKEEQRGECWLPLVVGQRRQHRRGNAKLEARKLCSANHSSAWATGSSKCTFRGRGKNSSCAVIVPHGRGPSPLTTQTRELTCKGCWGGTSRCPSGCNAAGQKNCLATRRVQKWHCGKGLHTAAAVCDGAAVSSTTSVLCRCLLRLGGVGELAWACSIARCGGRAREGHHTLTEYTKPVPSPRLRRTSRICCRQTQRSRERTDHEHRGKRNGTTDGKAKRRGRGNKGQEQGPAARRHNGAK